LTSKEEEKFKEVSVAAKEREPPQEGRETKKFLPEARIELKFGRERGASKSLTGSYNLVEKKGSRQRMGRSEGNNDKNIHTVDKGEVGRGHCVPEEGEGKQSSLLNPSTGKKEGGVCPHPSLGTGEGGKARKNPKRLEKVYRHGCEGWEGGVCGYDLAPQAETCRCQAVRFPKLEGKTKEREPTCNFR